MVNVFFMLLSSAAADKEPGMSNAAPTAAAPAKNSRRLTLLCDTGCSVTLCFMVSSLMVTPYLLMSAFLRRCKRALTAR
jgi:hypothetical protein